MAKLVSKTYGDALFSLALEEGKIDSFYEVAKSLIPALGENEEFGNLMKHPQFTKEQKTTIIEETFQEKIPREIVGMMILLVKKGHADDMVSVFEYFVRQVKEEKKIGEVYVTTAIDLSQEQKEKVEKRLLETTGYQTLEMQYEVDASLIGGMKIRIGDRVADSSVKNKLYELTRNLREVQV